MKDALRAALARYSPSTIDDEPRLARAAVLALFYDAGGEPHLVFQRRSERVLHHKGQVSFPGGAMDPGDEHPQWTALRETHEEIGVAPEDVEVLGQLDELITISGFRVTPFVGWLRAYPYPWRFSAEEVAYLLEVPFATLRDPKNYVPDVRTYEGRQVVLPSYRVGPDLIWGATARIVANLLDVCLTIPDLEPARGGA
ncbi:MAG: CoA pyrophosphatase [Chloroflexota bacterium]|nr:CoA pyrophosphatase [Dehalococcoidia bacterium]MDW8045716.1 CoA pyrophosphatase [Chloroflexota bacterium]